MKVECRLPQVASAEELVRRFFLSLVAEKNSKQVKILVLFSHLRQITLAYSSFSIKRIMDTADIPMQVQLDSVMFKTKFFQP